MSPLAEHAPGRLIIGYDSTNHNSVQSDLSDLGYALLSQQRYGGIYSFSPLLVSTEDAIAEVELIEFVDYAEPDYLFTTASVDCSAVDDDCRSSISDLEETLGILDQDQFIISTLDEEGFLASKKVNFLELKNKIILAVIPEAVAATKEAITQNSLGWSSNWVNADQNGNSVGNGERLEFEHDLGTTDFVPVVFLAEDENGTNAHMLDQFHEDDAPDGATYGFGIGINSITNNSIALQFGSKGYFQLNTGGSNSAARDFSGTFIKVVLKTI
jgi:hypothetical protein